MEKKHKNKKAYNRKRDRKNFDYNSDGLSFFYICLISNHIHLSNHGGGT